MPGDPWPAPAPARPRCPADAASGIPHDRCVSARASGPRTGSPGATDCSEPNRFPASDRPAHRTNVMSRVVGAKGLPGLGLMVWGLVVLLFVGGTHVPARDRASRVHNELERFPVSAPASVGDPRVGWRGTPPDRRLPSGSRRGSLGLLCQRAHASLSISSICDLFHIGVTNKNWLIRTGRGASLGRGRRLADRIRTARPAP